MQTPRPYTPFQPVCEAPGCGRDGMLGRGDVFAPLPLVRWRCSLPEHAAAFRREGA